MTTFEFTLRIERRIAEESDMDDLYARCADCSLLVEGMATLLQFHREADSLANAIASAIAVVEQAGLTVKRIELERDSIVHV